MSERRTTARLDFEALRRAIERGDPDSMLEFYADDAGVRVQGAGAVSEGRNRPSRKQANRR